MSAIVQVPKLCRNLGCQKPISAFHAFRHGSKCDRHWNELAVMRVQFLLYGIVKIITYVYYSLNLIGGGWFKIMKYSLFIFMDLIVSYNKSNYNSFPTLMTQTKTGTEEFWAECLTMDEIFVVGLQSISCGDEFKFFQYT